MLQDHLDRSADVTISVLPCSTEEIGAFGAVRLDEDGRVVEFREKPKDAAARAGIELAPGERERLGVPPDRPYLASMGIYLFDKEVLHETLSHDLVDFGQHVLPHCVAQRKVQVGLPAAIGAQFAAPGHLVIDVDGDASIRMNLGELETVTTYELPVMVLVLNNFGDDMVKQWQKLYYKGRLSASDKSLRKKDFVKTAEADGFQYAVRLERKQDLERVVGEWLAFSGPAFLEVIIDPDAGVYPMVGPGLSYDQMITGDFIPNRTNNKDPGTPGGSSMF